MKKSFLISLILVQACIAFSQNYCVNDTIVREIQFPLTKQDTKPVFYYFNNEWIAEAIDMVETESISKMEVKEDEYGNQAVFITVSPETLAKLKSDVREANKNRWINYDPIAEFPGGNGKLKEWIDENIRIPEGFKGSERIYVKVTVHPDGSVSDATIIRNPSKNEAVNQEALRLVNALPKFRVRFATPRKHNLYYTIPITFKEPGAIFIRGNNTSTQDASISNNKDESKVFSCCQEQQPEYLNGGNLGFRNELYSKLLKTAPTTQEDVSGRALVRFYISEEGLIVPESIKVIGNRSVPQDYLDAAIEAIKGLGRFEPGKMSGVPKKVAFSLPIIYPVPLEFVKTKTSE